jgi:SAM-dependent methyltransferase
MSAALFDTIAPRYDDLWTNSPAGRAQRDQVWRHSDGLFLPGHRILDIGCGTGEDAAHFAARGIHVHAIDASAPMIAIARRRGAFHAEVCPAEEIARIAGPFDGAISNFGALNCVPGLPRIARDLAALVRPGGRVAICLLGRFCAWETLYFGSRLEWRKAARRWKGRAVAHDIAVHYPTARAVRRAFSPAFHLRRWVGIGALVPPSYVNLPLAPLAYADRILGALPLLRAAADHRLYILERNSC